MLFPKLSSPGRSKEALSIQPGNTPEAGGNGYATASMLLLRTGVTGAGALSSVRDWPDGSVLFRARLAIFVIDSLDQNVLLWFDVSQRGIVLASSLTISAISHAQNRAAWTHAHL